MHQRATALIPLFFLAAFAFLGSIPEAQSAPTDLTAEQEKAVARIQKLNRHAMELFDEGEFQLAEKALLEALGEGKKAGLTKTSAVLSTHGNLGVVYSVGLKDARRAIGHFREALTIKPDLKLSKQRTASETEKNFALARVEYESGVRDEMPLSPAKSESPAVALKCPLGGDVKKGDEVTLKCLSSGPTQPASISLHYKPEGEPRFQSLAMVKGEKNGEVITWSIKIPGSATTGRWVPYYFEARDGKGGSMAMSGRPERPNVLTVKGSSAVPTSSELESEEESEEEEDAVDDANPLARLERERRREHYGSTGTFWLGLGVGTGFGYANASSTEAYGRGGRNADFNPGLAFAALAHAVPEIGYFVGRNTALAITGRNQYMQYSDKKIATGANTVLLRLLFFTEETEDSNVRIHFAIDAGGGEGFRFRVKAMVINSDGSDGATVNDSVRGGPFVVGGGVGLAYKVNRHWRWTLESQALLGFPHVSAVMDASTGARYEF